MSLPKIYENSEFIILGDNSKKGQARPSYVLINKNKKFEVGHTHLNNFNTAKWIMNLYKYRRIPLDLHNEYLLESLIRISDDEDYTRRIKQLITTRKRKSKEHYYNVQKGAHNKKGKR